MTAAQLLARGRAAARALMVDTCAIDRPGTPLTDPDTGQVTTATVPVYAGACKVTTYEAQESDQDVATASRTVQRYTLHIPAHAPAPRVGDLATITTTVYDPALVGRRFRIVALLHKTWATAQRLGVEEVSTDA